VPISNSTRRIRIATDFQGKTCTSAIAANTRVQVLDNDLTWKANYANVGNPWGGVRFRRTRFQRIPASNICTSSNSWPDSAPAAAADFTGEVYKMELDGTIVGQVRQSPARRAGRICHDSSDGLPRIRM